ncbi:MAG: redoxin domain-containing protein [Planctomycetota bacterium]
MKAFVIATMCVGFLLTGVARADLETGTYAPDIEAEDWMNTEGGEPISLSELRGMVVVLYFWVSWHAGGENLIPMINQVENHPRLGRRRGVFIMGVTESDRSRVEEMVEEERIFFPIALESKAHEEYEINSFPRVVVIDPEGKIAYTGWPGQDRGEEFVTQILDVIANVPPTRTHPREAAECQRYLERARDYIRAADYKAAFQVARNAHQRALTGDQLKTKCQDMLDLIEALGRDQLATGLQLVDNKDYEGGVTYLRDVMRLFRGMQSSKTAKRRLKSLEERYPEVKRVLESLKHHAEARGLLAAARDDLWNRSFGPACETLERLLKDYDDTEIAASARIILDRMEKNQTIMGYVRDHKASRDCTNWMGQARSFKRVGNFSKAKEYFRKVIDEHPNTIFAEEAYRELAELP